MSPFWREAPLTEHEQLLLDRLYEAHAQSAFRENCSTQALCVAAAGSRSLPQSLIAALSTLGERHAPLVATYELLSDSDPVGIASFMLANGQKVPGWGNSFYKGPDPLWVPVMQVLDEHFIHMAAKLTSISAVFYSRGKPLQPNPSAFTAATAIILGMPKELSPWLFISARLTPWCHLFQNSIK